jgi:hypothetical protein
MEDAEAPVRLGRRFPVMDRSGELWRERLDAAYQSLHDAHGQSWTLGDEGVRQQVAQAHEGACRRAFAHIENEAALARTGARGRHRVDTHGLVAAVFDQPDSRTGDLNQRMHFAVSAKVQGVDGK